LEEGATPESDAAATQLLADYDSCFGLASAPPVPVEEIARSLLVLWIDEADDLRTVPGAPTDQGRLSGLLVPSELTIWLDRGEAARSSGRRRFTIAHEIGHFVLHARRSQAAATSFCRGSDLERADLVEGEANRFAAGLLMPELLLEREAMLCGCNIPLLAERFAVSVSAMRLRLLTLDLLPVWMR
jgi:hypothetical protein